MAAEGEDGKSLTEGTENAAYALAVVSVQKQQTQPVEVGEPASDVSDETGFSSESIGSDANQGANAFKAGSALPEDRMEVLDTNQVFIVRYLDELYALTAAQLGAAFPELAKEHASKPGTIDLRGEIQVRTALTRSAVAELIRTVGSNNIVRYDGQFYVVPHGIGEVGWGDQDPSEWPGVKVAGTAREAFAIAEEQLSPSGAGAGTKEASGSSGPQGKGSRVPHLIKAVESYNIVEFEGWYYGLPHALGSIDLASVDVIEMPGVIRDVSMDVVEREIQELKGQEPESSSG